MNGVISKTLAATTLAGGLAATGCTPSGKCVDPCYPERYIAQARTATHAAFAPQVQNGHILDQTVWNYHFESGKDELNAGGRDHLDGLVRRRPSPSGRVFLATARDLVYDAANPDKYPELRRELDEKRAVAIQKYLQAQTAGRPMQFEIVLHDPQEVGQHAAPVNRSITLNHNTTTGSLSTGTSANAAGQGQGQNQGGSSASSSGQQGGGSSGSSGQGGQ
jgi:uncharacterized membrane protein YgcG